MNIVDIGILVIMFLSALMGIMKGATREVLGFMSWAAAGFSTFFSLPLVQSFARSYIQNPMLADIVSGVILFIFFLVLFGFISQFFSGLVRQSGLGGIDRSLGFGYGLLRGFILICFVEMIMGIFVSRGEYPALLKDSHLNSAIYKGSDFLFPFLPTSLRHSINQQKQKHVSPFHNSEKDLTSQAGSMVTDALKTQIQHGVQAIIPSAVSNQSPPPSLSKNEKWDDPKTPLDTQKTVEELARLKPKPSEVKTSTTTYTKKQRLDMDRLLQHEEPER